MKIRPSLLLLAAASVLFVGPAVASPFITFYADGARETIEVPWYTDNKGVARVDDWYYSTSEYSIHLHDVAMDPDPFIAYAIGVSDLGAPSTFGFVFGTPIVPTPAPNIVVGSLVGGVTDLTGDGASLTPIAATTQVSEVGFPLTNMGVDVGAAFSTGPGDPGALYSYGAYSAGPMAGPGPGPWTWLQVSTTFTLSGEGDLAALTGYSSIVDATIPVPEPGSFALMGGGLLALAITGWRRKRLAR